MHAVLSAALSKTSIPPKTSQDMKSLSPKLNRAMKSLISSNAAVKFALQNTFWKNLENLIFAACLFALGTPAFATSFTISSGTTVKQSLAAGETGTVTSAGSLTVTGNNVAITVTGNSTITNSGTIQQATVNTGGNAGNGRAIRDNTGGLTLTVNNGSPTNSTALIQTADADVIQMKVAGSTVTFNNYGTLNSLNPSGGGNQAIDWNALTATGSNTLNNFSTGIITATEADAVRPGVNGVVINAGTIKSTTSTGSSSDGIDAQNNTGLSVTNSGLTEGARHGITGGAVDNTVLFTTSITNNLGGTIQGDNGAGVNLDGFDAKQTATIVNHGTITGNGHDIGDGLSHDGDGVDVDGLVDLTNTGIIRSINAYSTGTAGVAQSEGMTVGGGTIVNSGTIEGLVSAGNTNAVGRGISLLGNDSVAIPGTREAIYGNATVTNQAGGLIRGQTDSGIAVGGPASGFTVTINNNAGATILGGGTSTAGIQTGADNDTITNSGTINGSSSGLAIDMGAGNNMLNISGGTASILGNISGGISGTNVLTIAPGSGNTFSYSGTISNFRSAQITAGTFNLSGVMTTSGSTGVNGGTLAGSGRVSGLVVVMASGTISPGTNQGKLTLQTGLNLAGGGTYLWQLGALKDNSTGTAGTDFDQISLSGNLALGGSSKLTLDFSLLGGSDPNSSNFYWNSNHSWTLVNGSSATNTGSTNFAALTNASFADGTFTSSADNLGNVTLQYQAVPEPQTLAMLVGGIGTLGFWRRMRRRAV